MAVNLSPVGGVAAQFLDNNGNVLTGGKIYTYAAGTTTPQASYTSSTGVSAHSNPIILDASGRVPTGEVWLTDGLIYKFVIKTADDVTIGTYDNINGINSNFVNFTNQQEIQTATAGQTVFNLTSVQYAPGTNSLSVFVDGVNQYGPSAQYAYVETDSTTVTFVSGLHVGASVKFTTSQLNSTAGSDATLVSYVPPFTNAVGTNVAAKLSQYISIKDFGAVGNGIADDTAAIQAAIDSLPADGGAIFIPGGVYKVTGIKLDGTSGTQIGVKLYGEGRNSKLLLATGSNGANVLAANAGTDFVVSDLTIDGNVTGNPTPISPTDPDYLKWNGIRLSDVTRAVVQNCLIANCGFGAVLAGAANLSDNGSQQIIVQNNFFRDNGFGLSAMYQAGNVIANNVVVSNSSYGIVIDQFSERCTVEGNVVLGNGHNGIYGYRVKDCTFTGNVCVDNAQIGIVLDNGSVDNTITGNTCGLSGNSGIALNGGCYQNTVTSNACRDNGQYGISVQASGNNIVSNNTIRANTFSGIGVLNSPNTVVTGNHGYTNRGSGLFIQNSDGGVCSGNIFVDNNQAGNASDSGIRLLGTSSAWTITGNSCFDDQAVKTQNYGVLTEGSSTGHVIMTNKVTANKTAGMSLVGTNSIRQNIGWSTESNGSAKIDGGNTSVVVNHGLSQTPSVNGLSVTATTTIAPAVNFWISNVTATQFTINLDAATLGDAFFVWQAQIL